MPKKSRSRNATDSITLRAKWARVVESLSLIHILGDHSRSVKEGGWSSCPDFCYWNTPRIELTGKTFGVIGYGRIGRAAAKLAAAFGMEAVSYTHLRRETH